jgi:amino acid adenylation domain-containing protein
MNASTIAPIHSRSVRDMFAAIVRQAPDAGAVRDANVRLTYRELSDRAAVVAVRLRQLGVGREDVVAVLTEPSVDMVVASLGVVLAGAAYLPLDPAWPEPQLRATVQHTGPRAIVASPGTAADARRLVAGDVLVLDDQSSTTEAAPLSGDEGSSPERLFSVVSTSGTTGNPKNVLIPERAVLNRLAWMWEAHPYASGDVSLLYRSHAAIGFTWDCFGPLLRGVPVVIAAPASVRDPRDLVEMCIANEVSVVSASAGRWEAIADHVSRHRIEWRALRFARCSGEALPPALVAKWRRVFPHAALINIYGSTECSSSASFDTAKFESGRVPVGDAVSNVSIYVLGDDLQQRSPGEVGLVYVGGACVARGYLGNPALTAERFLPDPFSPIAGRRMYSTGDLGIRDAVHGLEIVGRRDRQVKIRGFRVELAEVESALRLCPGVLAAAVTAEERGLDEARLVAYVVALPQSEWSPARLRDALSQRVGEHMIPGAFVQLSDMPLTSTGKIAYAALASQPIAAAAPVRTPATTGTEKQVAAMWIQVLGEPSVDVDDDFLAAGGDSLKAMQVLARIYDAFAVEIPLDQFLNGSTIRTLSAAIDTAGRGAEPSKDSGVMLDIRRLVHSLAPAAADLPDEASFFDAGAVDSLTFLTILREIESRYALSLLNDGTVLADLHSISEIASHITRHRQAAVVGR